MLREARELGLRVIIDLVPNPQVGPASVATAEILGPARRAGQEDDPAGTLWFHRNALRLRRETGGLDAAGLLRRDAPEGVLDFDRGEALRYITSGQKSERS